MKNPFPVRSPILVRHVNNLTDARYFSAAGVDWISLDVADNAESFARFQVIRDWVEGVRIAAEPLADDENLLARILVDLQPDGLVLGPGMSSGIPAHVQVFLAVRVAGVEEQLPGQKLILDFTDERQDNWREADFLEADWTTESIAAVRNAGFAGGFVLSGQHEEEIGVKDFTRLDEVMNLLCP